MGTWGYYGKEDVLILWSVCSPRLCAIKPKLDGGGSDEDWVEVGVMVMERP